MQCLKANEFIELIQSLNINGTIDHPNYKAIGYAVEVRGTTFFNPIDCHYSFILGKGDDEYKTCIGDIRYKQIEGWLTKNVIPKVCSKLRYSTDSYQLKHMCENYIGGYVSNETIKFILAMHEVPTIKSHDKYPINIRYSTNERIRSK